MGVLRFAMIKHGLHDFPFLYSCHYSHEEVHSLDNRQIYSTKIVDESDETIIIPK